MRAKGKTEPSVWLREDAELARRALALHERGLEDALIAQALGVSRNMVVNLLGIARRLTAGRGPEADR